MRVKCPKCGTIHDYAPTASQKRKRKYCINPTCVTGNGKRTRFDITPSRAIPDVVNIKDQSQKPPKPLPEATLSGVVNTEDHTGPSVNRGPIERLTTRGTDVERPKVGKTTLLNLDDINIRILDGLKISLSMADLSRQEQISKAAISKRVKKLVKIGLLVEKNTYPKTFDVLPELHQFSAQDFLHGIRIHKFQVLMQVIATNKRFDVIKQSFKRSRPNNWYKYIFHYKHVTLQYNEGKMPNLQAHITAAGRTLEDAYDNAEKKAFKLRDELEAHFPMVLANPTYKAVDELNYAVDFVLGTWNDEQMKILQTVYYDKSDPDAIFETGNVEAIKSVLKVMNTYDNVQKDFKDYKNEVNQKLDGLKNPDIDLKQQIEDMRNDISQLTSAVSALVKTMTSITSSPVKEPEGGIYQ